MTQTVAPVSEMAAYVTSYGSAWQARKAALFAKHGQSQALLVLFTNVRTATRTAA